MGIFNTGYDKNLNRKDPMGYSYDRNSGSYLGKVDKENYKGEGFIGKLILMCFVLFIVPGFITGLEHRHPELRIIIWVIVFIWAFWKFRKIILKKVGMLGK